MVAYGDQHLRPLRYNAIPKQTINAVLSIEDHRFFNHRGFDFWGLGRALFENITAGHVVQGGSTLTQQLAKTLFLSPERSLKRKLQEFIVSVWLEENFTKKQIVEIYFNRVYMGPGIYGFASASQYYYGKPLKNITLEEAAGLAGLLKAPNTYNPFRNLLKFKQRAETVVQKMYDLGKITEKQRDTALKNLKAFSSRRHTTLALPSPSTRYYTDWIFNQLPQFVGNLNQDLKVYTTFDSLAQKALESSLTILEKSNLPVSTQAALVLMTTTGAVPGLVGGRDYFSSSFNRSVQAKRQTGSVFKLFVYSSALMKGKQPHDKVSDKPIRLGDWRPKNYGWKSRGTVSIDDALAYSINTATIRIAKKVGPKAPIRLARLMGGIDAEPRNSDLSMMLGTLESSPLSITTSMAILANEGKRVTPYGIRIIKSSNEKILYKYSQPNTTQIIQPSIASSMMSMLEKAVIVGTAKKCSIPGRAIAAKTGTTQNHKDAWIVAASKPYVLGIWLGHDNNEPLPGKVTGGKQPAMMARHVFKSL